MEEQPSENITIVIENVETMNVVMEAEESCEQPVCNCDMNDPNAEHGPLCPGAVKPETPDETPPESVEETIVEPVEETIPESVQETIPESVQETIVEPVEETIVEPDQETIVESVQETIVEPVEETIPEPTPDREGASGGTVGSPDIPDLVFIVPYRDREQQQKFFSQQMKIILEDIPENKYKIYYIHQHDKREFNRGAMKNIGFLMVKNKYPNDYKNITLVFNDVDTMPYSKNFLNYYTTPGKVKHFYGVKFALGGIVSITAGDFEKTAGFPNFWAWGYEDNLLNIRVLKVGLTIDRDQFYPLMDKNIFQMKDGLERLVNKGEFDRFLSNTTEGYHSIVDLDYVIDEMSGFVIVNRFNTGIPVNPQQNKTHDLRNGNKPFPVMMNKRRMPRMGMNL